MESGMLIMCVVLTALLITPFIFFRDGKRKSRSKILMTNLADLAKMENCNISKQEVCNDAVIGINIEAHKLFFIKGQEPAMVRTLVHLKEVKRSRVSVVSRSVERKGDSQKIIENIAIVLEHKSSLLPDVMLPFYDSEVDGMTLSGELQLAEKWNAIINEDLVARMDRVGRVG